MPISLFQRISIGFIVVPGFRAADVIETQAILGLFPGNESHYIAETLDCVYGQAKFPLVPSTTFETCPLLDVLVVGEIPEAELDNTQFIRFIHSKVSEVTHVIGVSSGVVALAKAGALKGYRATADQNSMNKLSEFGVIPVHQRSPVVDGKYHTSGPSTGGIESAFVVMRKLRGGIITKFLELNLEYNPTQHFPKISENGKSRQFPSARDVSKPLKVAVLVPPDLYVPDIMGAIDVLASLSETEFFYVWQEKTEVKGVLGPVLMSDTTFQDCPLADILIMGATLPKYSADSALSDFLIRQEKGASAIISICAGALLLGNAGLLDGRKMTTNFHMLDLLHHFGAIPSEKEVEVDGKFYSAGPAVGSYEAALLAVRDLYGEAIAQHIEQDILEYDPHPIFGVGSPKLAGTMLTSLSQLLSSLIKPFYYWKMKEGYRTNKKLSLPTS